MGLGSLTLLFQHIVVVVVVCVIIMLVVVAVTVCCRQSEDWHLIGVYFLLHI